MEKIYYRKIILANLPINGYFKFKNNFQLLPLDEEPIVQCLQGYPAVLEFCFDRESVLPSSNTTDEDLQRIERAYADNILKRS